MTSRSSGRVAAALTATFFLLPTLALADDHRPPSGQGPSGQGHGQQQGQPQQHGEQSQQHRSPGQQAQHQGSPSGGHPEFQHDESRYARDYYRDHKWDAPRPRQRIHVGYKLPRDYRQPLPQDLRGRFHARPGYDYYMVGDDIVLVALTTGLIVDILVNVH